MHVAFFNRSLANAISGLYHDRATAERMGANARRAALEFDRPRQVKAYYGLFQELVAERRSREVSR
jgi:20S proteasome alpha/beta subunit